MNLFLTHSKIYLFWDNSFTYVCIFLGATKVVAVQMNPLYQLKKRLVLYLVMMTMTWLNAFLFIYLDKDCWWRKLDKSCELLQVNDKTEQFFSDIMARTNYKIR
jgi:hypothetical protein